MARLVSRAPTATPTSSHFTHIQAARKVVALPRPGACMANQVGPFANRMGLAPGFTFVSTTGPTLDEGSAKAMRAHTTRANFARRRRRLVQDYAAQKESAAYFKYVKAGDNTPTEDRNLVLVNQKPHIMSRPGLDQRLNRNDAFYIQHLTKAMERLHLVPDIPESEAPLALIQSDWARFLPDPTMHDVCLYFARHVYASRRHNQQVQFILDTYKGKAIQSVRERLAYGSDGLTDSLVAAILILTVADQVLGNIEAWKIHISGLLQIIETHSRNSHDSRADWISNAVPRTTIQGLLVLARHDATVLNTVEKTGMFDTMFSAPAKKAAYLILENAEQVTLFVQTNILGKSLDKTAQQRLGHVIKSLNEAIELGSAAYPREAFLTAMAWSIKVFLGIAQRHSTGTGEDPGDTAVQLMHVFQRPEQQLPSSLALCSSLESLFWQTMMGAIAAPNDSTRQFFMSRMDRITAAAGLASWDDALVTLQRYFWIPSIFSDRGYRIFSEVMQTQGHIKL